MKLVAEKLPVRKFKNGDAVRCIRNPELQGIVVGSELSRGRWLANIRITQSNSSGICLYKVGDVAALVESYWEKIP